MTDVDLAPVRPFHEWFADQARGTADLEATQALQEVVQAVMELGGKGEVIIKVKVEPQGSAGIMVGASVIVTAKPPQPQPEASVFYADRNGSLVRDDPNQARLPLKTVDKTTGEIIDLSANPEGNPE